jgi:hypothetical protein
MSAETDRAGEISFPIRNGTAKIMMAKIAISEKAA